MAFPKTNIHETLQITSWPMFLNLRSGLWGSGWRFACSLLALQNLYITLDNIIWESWILDESGPSNKMIQGNGVNWTIIIWLLLKVFSRTTLVRSLVVLNRFYPRWSCWFVELRPSCFSQPGNSHGPDLQYPLVVRNQHTSPRFGNLWCSADIWLAVVLHAILSQASRWNRHVFLNCLAWRHAQHGRPLKIFRGIKAACRGVPFAATKIVITQ